MTEPATPTLELYRQRFGTCARLPAVGRGRQEILAEMEAMRALEAARWSQGYASGAVYHGDADHLEFLHRVYALNSQANPLHADLWPSAIKFEAEIVAMTGAMLGAEQAGAAPGSDEAVCGVVSAGGTESILLAVKAYRDWARAEKGIREPEMIVPTTAHAAFDKAAQCFAVRIVRVPVGTDYRADVAATEHAITANTILLVGSAPAFPHGTVDPIDRLSELARVRGIGFHTDACLGGFILPWAERLGHEVPPFDFRLPGVTSVSADTHKFGFAPKGTSVILYRGHTLRHHQYFTATDWPGGLYCSPSFAGSRPGALVAACWAAMVSIGEQGYLESTRRVLEAARKIREGVRAIPELRILGDPLFVIAFESDRLDIYKLMDAMAERGWSLNGLHKPPSLHLCTTLRHAEPGVAERFIEDLGASVAFVRDHPGYDGRLAPMYGMANTIPDRGAVADLLAQYMDGWYRVR